MEQELFRVNDRPLSGLAFDYVFMDGIWFSSIGPLSKAKKDRVVLAVMGYSKERNDQTFLGFAAADAESAAKWKELLASIAKRGFDIASAKLAIADDGAGLLAALEDVAPSLPVQLCIAHRYRNVLVHTSMRNKRAVADDLKKLTAAATKEDAKTADQGNGEAVAGGRTARHDESRVEYRPLAHVFRLPAGGLDAY
jgi:putative transposase